MRRRRSTRIRRGRYTRGRQRRETEGDGSDEEGTVSRSVDRAGANALTVSSGTVTTESRMREPARDA
eukprot:5591031-Pyramimonas_sp.AAC.1